MSALEAGDNVAGLKDNAYTKNPDQVEEAGNSDRVSFKLCHFVCVFIK